MYLPSSFILRYVRSEMNVHAIMNELGQKDYWYPRRRKNVNIYVQSQWRVVLLWYHIFWQSSIQRGRHTQLCIITSLKWIIQICSNFYWWVSKILLSTHPIHIVVWGNFRFPTVRQPLSINVFLIARSHLHVNLSRRSGCHARQFSQKRARRGPRNSLIDPVTTTRLPCPIQFRENCLTWLLRVGLFMWRCLNHG